MKRPRTPSKRHGCRSTVAVFGFVAVLCARPALAQAVDSSAGPKQRTTSSDTDTEEDVKKLMRLGVSEYRKGHLDAARDALTRAFALRPHVAIAETLAEVETQLGQYRAAASHWSFFLEHLPAERENERSEVEAALADCRKHLGSVSISVDVPEANVLVDGESLGPSPIEREIWVNPGEHTVVAEAANGSDRAIVSIAAGESKTAMLHIRNRNPSAPTGTAETVMPPPPPEGPTSAAPVSNAKHGLAPRTVVLVAGGVATLTAAVVGTTFVVLANRAGSSVDAINAELDAAAAEKMIPRDEICSPAAAPNPIGCSDLAKKQSEQTRDKNIATVSFVTAGGLALLTVGGYFLWPKSGEAHASANTHLVEFAPWFTKSGAGMAISLSTDLFEHTR